MNNSLINFNHFPWNFLTTKQGTPNLESKYPRSRSLFEALKMLYFNKYKSNLKTLSEMHKMSAVILWSFTPHMHR